MKPKDIFGLAVRLLGLYFLYLGLYALSQMLGSDIADIFKNPDKTDLINDLLPIVFDLAVASWLLAGGFLVRMAYSDAPKISGNPPIGAKQPEPTQESPPAPGLTDMDRAEKKLAALVEKPKEK